MVVAAFLVIDKANEIRFFEWIFLVASVSLEIIFGMPFLTLNNADINFLDQKLRWKTYTTKEALLTTRHVELVGKKKFATTVFHPEHEIYIFHIGSVSFDMSPSTSSLELDVNTFYRLYISGLIDQEALTKVPNEYINFANIFSPVLVSKLPKHIAINNNAIKLVNG